MSPHPLLGPLASPSCRSLSTPASSTPTASPPSRSLPSSALPCGDYGIAVVGRLVAAVERKSLADLVSSIINGKLRYAIGDLAALPRAAVVVEDRDSQIFKLDGVRPAVVADGLAELQVRWPSVPIAFNETRQLAEEWTYRYLAAAHAWAETEHAIVDRVGIPIESTETATAPEAASPSTAEVRVWARSTGLAVPERGRCTPTSGKPGATRIRKSGAHTSKITKHRDSFALLSRPLVKPPWRQIMKATGISSSLLLTRAG